MIASLRGVRGWAPLCAIAVAAFGCGGDEVEPAAEAVERVEMVEEGVSPPPLEPPGPTGLDLPADFPADVPHYPGAELSGVNVSPDGVMFLSYRSTDAVADVVRHLAEAFAAQGWSAKSSVEETGSTVFADKGGRSATVFVTTDAEDGATLVDLFLSGNG